MKKQEIYKQENLDFLQAMAGEEGVKALPQGVLYKVLKRGMTGRRATAGSIVSVYYKGSLINGKVFDDNTRQGYPDAFRLSELIVGWQIAIPQMEVGDLWRIFIPAQVGYGSMGMSGIPKHSTLIFDIELVNVS